MNMKAFLITQIPKILLILLSWNKFSTGIYFLMNDCPKFHLNNLNRVKKIDL